MTDPGSQDATPRVGDVVADRYRVERVIVPTAPRRRLLAIENGTKRRAEIVEIPMSSAVAWTTAMTIEHPGLANLLATVSRHGVTYGIFEHIEGKTLIDRLGGGEVFDAAAAVRITLSLVDAVGRLRRAQVVHGAIDSECVVFPDGQSEGAQLTYRGTLVQGSPFRPPERGMLDPPEPADDLWGLAAVLYQLLASRSPPTAGIYSEAELREAGIDDEVLRGVLAQGLAADPGRRSERLASLAHPLAAWVARRAAAGSAPGSDEGARAKAAGLRALGLSKVSDDPQAPAIEVRATTLSEPPPEEDPAPSIEVRESAPPAPSIELRESTLPDAPDAPAPSTSAPPPVAHASPAPGTRRGVWIGGGALAAVAIAAVAVMGWRPDPAPAPAPSAVRAAPAAAPAPPPRTAARAAPPAAQPPPSATAPPVVHRVADETTASCVERHLPEGSFRSRADMEFLCTTHDPRKGDHLMRAALVTAADGNSSAPALRMWSGLSWYGMPAFAALRAACCPDAPAVELPPPADGCTALGPLLDDIGNAAVHSSDLDRPLERFRSAVACEIENQRSVVYWRKERPGGAEETTLRGLLQRLARPRPPP